MDAFYDDYDLEFPIYSRRLPLLPVDDYYSDPTDEIGKYMRILSKLLTLIQVSLLISMSTGAF